jgi:hypothetical protein
VFPVVVSFYTKDCQSANVNSPSYLHFGSGVFSSEGLPHSTLGFLTLCPGTSSHRLASPLSP